MQRIGPASHYAMLGDMAAARRTQVQARNVTGVNDQLMESSKVGGPKREGSAVSQSPEPPGLPITGGSAADAAELSNAQRSQRSAVSKTNAAKAYRSVETMLSEHQTHQQLLDKVA